MHNVKSALHSLLPAPWIFSTKSTDISSLSIFASTDKAETFPIFGYRKHEKALASLLNWLEINPPESPCFLPWVHSCRRVRYGTEKKVEMGTLPVILSWLRELEFLFVIMQTRLRHAYYAQSNNVAGESSCGIYRIGVQCQIYAVLQTTTLITQNHQQNTAATV